MKDNSKILPHLKLRFNYEHPTIEESYFFGYECALADLDIEENPFPKESVSYDSWQEGWWTGFYGEKPLFELTPYPNEDESYQIEGAANDDKYYQDKNTRLRKWLKITSAIAASAIVGYQVLDIVA